MALGLFLGNQGKIWQVFRGGCTAPWTVRMILNLLPIGGLD
jgi:uncharacterized membrane protein YedE/YeeE